jgi:hypothetical protein
LPQKGFQVINSARQGSTSGEAVGSTGSGADSSSSGRTGANMALIAFPETQLSPEGKSDSPTGASKLRVGPAFLADRFLSGSREIFGPYWVVAVGQLLLTAKASSDPIAGLASFLLINCGVAFHTCNVDAFWVLILLLQHT